MYEYFKISFDMWYNHIPRSHTRTNQNPSAMPRKLPLQEMDNGA